MSENHKVFEYLNSKFKKNSMHLHFIFVSSYTSNAIGTPLRKIE